MSVFNFKKIVTWVLAALAITACSNDSELRWTEEVKLADGRIIVVKRYSEFKAPHEIGQPSGESYTRLEFEHPVTKEAVRFESKLRADSVEMIEAGEKASSDPGIMHRPHTVFLSNGDVYLLTKPLLSIYPFYGCPDPPFLLYRWNGGSWQRRPLEEIPQRRFSPNLTIDPLQDRRTIRSKDHYLEASEVISNDIGYGPIVIDFSGMTQQTFDVPPNCKTCTVYVTKGRRADSPKAGPFCTRSPRDWFARKHLTN